MVFQCLNVLVSKLLKLLLSKTHLKVNHSKEIESFQLTPWNSARALLIISLFLSLNPKTDSTAPMECNEAASTVFPFFAKTLQKYLKTTRQQLPRLMPSTPERTCEPAKERHLNDSQEDSSETPKQPQQIIQYLATCLKYDLSPLVFLRRLQSKTSRVYEAPEEDLLNELYNVEKGETESARKSEQNSNKNPLVNYSNWSLICDELSNRMVRHGTEFLLRKDDVSLYVTISKLPDFALSEEVINPNCNKFVLSSETCV